MEMLIEMSIKGIDCYSNMDAFSTHDLLILCSELFVKFPRVHAVLKFYFTESNSCQSTVIC